MALVGSDFLYVYMEIAMAFVGFSTIIVVFRQMSGEPLGPFLLFLTRFLIGNGLVALLMAALPLLLHHHHLSEERVWQWSSVALAMHILGMMIYYLRGQRRHAHENPSTGARPLLIFNFAGSIALALYLLANAVLLREFGPYSLGLIWLGWTGGSFLVRILEWFMPGRAP